MAIRFVNVDPEKDGGKTGKDEPAARVRQAEAAPRPVPEDAPAPTEDDSALPGLPHAKPEPKPRGRKAPLAAAAKPASPAPDAPEQPLLDGLLPGLQVHAKPTPKPRGRKKAFG